MKIRREISVVFYLEDSEQFDVFNPHFDSVRVDRVIYEYNPDGDNGEAFEELDMKGRKLKANGTVDKRAGDYHYAYPGPEVEAQWMAKAREQAQLIVSKGDQ